jgi:tetratricopeptide (TPR) repeat protein
MAKIGRNDPCPCGSGKKYKQCCLAKDESAVIAASPPAKTKQSRRYARAEALAEMAAEYAWAEQLTKASNAVVDLIHEGKLDEAEQAAHELLERFPEVQDGYDRLGMVYEARGNKARAADYYRKALNFIREADDSHAPEMEEVYRRLIDRLDPPAV